MLPGAGSDKSWSMGKAQVWGFWERSPSPEAEAKRALTKAL